jgi:oligosaccharyl transferase STT3 subunit
MLPAHYHRLVDRLLVATIVTALFLALAAIVGVGFSTSLGGIRISSRTLFRPFIVMVVAVFMAVHVFEHRQQQLLRLWAATLRHASAVAFCLAALAIVMALRFSAFEANAADQYGYVSQAHLWARGNLITHEPLAAIAPWPEATWTFAPLGYRPGQEPATIVPTYSPGLPLVMAGLLKLFGPDGVYMAVPFLGSLAVWATFLLGKRFAGPACGLMAAMLLLTSPVFLFQLKEPMSDVPVTAWWLIAILLVAARTAPTALGGGLAASAAISTRPNLVPLAVVLGAFVLCYSSPFFRTRFRNASLFALGVVPSCMGIALFNLTLYGSPLESGYGSLESLFGVEYLRANLARYPRWLLETETPFVCFAAITPWLLRRSVQRHPFGEAASSGGSYRLSWLFLGLSATLFGCYAFYLPFDSWTFLRFLLPSIPLLLVLSSAAVLAFSQRLPSTSSRWLVAALLCLLVGWRWDTAVTRGLQPLRANDRRFEVMGEFVRDQLPPNAIVLTMIHSGSVRHYSGRPTLRWDSLPRESLDSALTFLRANGYRSYLLIEDWERSQFVERFAGHTSLAALDWPPFASYSGNLRADLFDLDDRNRFRAGDQAKPRTIGSVAPR